MTDRTMNRLLGVALVVFLAAQSLTLLNELLRLCWGRP
jgi:hypothetical protein